MKLDYLMLVPLLFCIVSFSMGKPQEVTIVTSDYQSFKVAMKLCTVSPVLHDMCNKCHDPSLSPKSIRLPSINSTDFKRFLPFLEITHNINNGLEGAYEILQKEISGISRKLILIKNKLLKSAKFFEVELLLDKLVNNFVDRFF